MKADRSRITIVDFAGTPPYSADGVANAKTGKSERFEVRNASCVMKADQDALLAGLESCSSLEAFNDWMHALLVNNMSSAWVSSAKRRLSQASLPSPPHGVEP